MRCLTFFQDVRADLTAGIDRQSLVLGPDTDLRQGCRLPCASGTSFDPRRETFPPSLHLGAQDRPQIARVFVSQVNLVSLAVQGERDWFVGIRPIKVIFQNRNSSNCHPPKG